MLHESPGPPPARAVSKPAAQAQTPFADAVLRLRRDAADDRILSFHALPWSQGRSINDDGRFSAKYRQLFGQAYLDAEISYSGSALDTYFRPTACLDLAQQLAADAFGADYTFFVTCGTTVSNQIAVDVLAGAGRRLLVDRTAHQSIHIATGHSPCDVDYAPCSGGLHADGQPLLDVPQMLKMVEAAVRVGRPYDAVVLAASSYDGVLYNLHRIFSQCLEISPTTAFLVDEAWSAINTFHSELRPLTALDAAGRIAAGGVPITALVTHSAHKSMSAARQGSYLHVVGGAALVARVASTLYGRHTTSPSIPILASLDLARAQAYADGEQLLQRALDSADQLHREIASDPGLSEFRTMPYPVTDAAHRRYFTSDPTKVFIDVTGLGISGDDARQRLFHDYGIYVSRTLPNGFLVNLHIGIEEADVDRLLDALRSLRRREYGRTGSHTPAATEVVQDLLIAYPPGVPVAFPGEPWTDQLRERLETSRIAGADIYSLPVSHRLATPVAATNVLKEDLS